MVSFWNKINNDWIFNIASILAYNLLLATFPLLILLLGTAGTIIGGINPAARLHFINNIEAAIPTDIGKTLVSAAVDDVQKTAGSLFIFGLVTSFFFGSRIFVVIENCFGIVFRLRGRDLIPQNIMAVVMLAIYLVLIPLFFVLSIIPTTIIQAILPVGNGTNFLVSILAFVGTVMGGFVLFGFIYLIVPNRPYTWHHLWPGTLVAGVLLVLYEKLFPWYTSVFLRPNSYGSIVGFAIVIVLFYYYLSFILLLGAEINSWIAGQRETSGDIQAILHELQAHNTTKGAAGPTAGEPQEDLMHGEGASAMRTDSAATDHEQRDHHWNIRFPLRRRSHPQ